MVKKFLPKRIGNNRKSKFDKIPHGPYCYKWLGTSSQGWSKRYKRYVTQYDVETCPFWKYVNRKPRCTYLQCGGFLIDDQCKECSINTVYL